MSAANLVCESDGYYTNCGYMSKKVPDENQVRLRARNRDRRDRQGPGHLTGHRQGTRERPASTVAGPAVTPRGHQRRWSVDVSKSGTSPAIIVRKDKKEPRPPQRGASLILLQSDTSFKRYSCPIIGASRPQRYQSSSSSSSSTCSCSSPPPVPTSVITGPDPLGWKLRPKSSSASRARMNRLSLQIPLPVVSPDPGSSPASNPEPSPRTKPPLRPKPPRRHSDSSAFLRSQATPQPVVTLDVLCGVHLRSLSLSDESDEVFGGGKDEEVKRSARPYKIPPLVPQKTPAARRIAQQIAISRQCCKTNEEDIYASILKPKRSFQTEHHSSLQGRTTAGRRVDTSCDRDRTTPRFPG